MPKKIRFIINPISGVNRNKILDDIIRENIDKDKYVYEIVNTERAFHAIELSREAVEKKYDIVVAVGGDGSVNEVAKALIGTNVNLGIIPAGSGNGLARHLKIPFNPVNAVKTINEAQSKLIDTINLNNESCISIAGVGFDALVAKKYAKEGRRGFWTYVKIITQEYISYKPKNYKLNIDGNEIERKALFICFANSNQFGYNTQIAPDAEVDDGLIDICIFQKIPLIETPLLSQLIFLRQLGKSRFVEIIKAKNVIVERKRNRVVNIDGEPVKIDKVLNVKINPSSLNVIVPVKT